MIISSEQAGSTLSYLTKVGVVERDPKTKRYRLVSP